MSYQNNGCPDCTEDKMCDKCYLGMAESVYEHAKNDLIEAQEAEGNFLAAISYWDVECSEIMNRIELFKKRLKEQRNGSSK